jgi:endonuclease/exonuclease/phosphatase (EEP) superfamily protein YafD
VGFVSNVKYRFNLREAVIENLLQAVKNDENPTIISGDFNTTSTMRNLDELFELTEDAQKYSNELLPATWDAYGIELWRIDYVLTKGEIESLKYESVDINEFSDHDAQIVYLDLI